jgi:thioredoxin reductase
VSSYPDERLDVAVVGGGPAGLSSALVLARCRRRVVVIDAGNPRNSASHGIHGFLTRDGTLPAEFLRVAREEVESYGVRLLSDTAISAERDDDGFIVTLRSGGKVVARKILLATGVVDRLPEIPDIRLYYGKSIHHCPYCDAWEHKDGRIAVYGAGKGGVSLALKMKIWSADVVLCTNGPSRIPEMERERLARYEVRVIEKKIIRLEGAPPQLERIVFEDGSGVDRTGMFFSTGSGQRSELIRQLGCEVTRKGAARIHRRQRSSVPGVFICGDAAEDSQYVIIAAAHGARAAMAINEDLQSEDSG